jgi:preprotein translocase subunit SecA
MPDRRWGDGLHQTIEAKEKILSVERKRKPTITYQKFLLNG